jgi:hypothetical protein
MADLTAQRAAYIGVLIKALEKLSKDGQLDEAMADHIEQLLGVGKPDHAGEAEYASWQIQTPAGVAIPDGGQK